MADNLRRITGQSGVVQRLVDVGGGFHAPEVYVVGGTTIAGTATPAVTPTISTSAYTSGDEIGGLMEFTDAFREDVGSGVLESVSILDLAKQSAEIDIVFFDRSITPTADNAAWDISDADMAHYLGFVKIGATDYVSGADYSVACRTGIGLLLKANALGTSIFATAVVRGGPTYAAITDLTITLGISQD